MDEAQSQRKAGQIHRCKRQKPVTPEHKRLIDRFIPPSLPPQISINHEAKMEALCYAKNFLTYFGMGFFWIFWFTDFFVPWSTFLRFLQFLQKGSPSKCKNISKYLFSYLFFWLFSGFFSFPCFRSPFSFLKRPPFVTVTYNKASHLSWSTTLISRGGLLLNKVGFWNIWRASERIRWRF